jgi:UDP-glucose/iron transport system ATP-binding protein
MSVSRPAAGDGPRYELAERCSIQRSARATVNQLRFERQIAGEAPGFPTLPVLEVRDLRTAILKPASFALSKGECVAIRGPSGAGKTLLLRAVADLDPNTGSVILESRNRSTIPGPEWRRLVGYVPAEPGWWAETVGEHFADRAAAAVFLNNLGFPDETGTWSISRLSTGERLRLALVRALIMRPKVLLLDEPTAALDAASVAAVESLIAAERQSGLAILWVTHDPSQARRIADRQLVMEAGCLRPEEGPCATTSL